MAEDSPVRRFYDYNFDEDTRFHEGLTVMKRHISTEAASNTSWLLKAKVFYYSKFIEPISLEECLGARDNNTLDRDDGEVVASADVISTLNECMQNFSIDNENSTTIAGANIVQNNLKRTKQHSVQQIVTATARDSDNVEITPNNDPDGTGRKIPDGELIISSSSDDKNLENVAGVCLVTNGGSVTTVPAEQVNGITSSDGTSHTTVPAEQVNVISSSDGTPPRVQTEQYNAITSSVGTPQPAVQTEQVNVITSSVGAPPIVQTEQYNAITSSVGTPQPTVQPEQVNVVSSSDGTPPTVPAEQKNIIISSDDMSDSRIQADCHNDEPTEADSGITDDKHSRLNTGDNSEAKSAPSEAPFVNENSGTDVFNLSSVEESLTFAEIINYVQKGEQIPGLLDLNIQPTNLSPTQSSATRKCKPWERDIIQP